MWKTVTSHSNYEVSSVGEVRNSASGKVLKPVNNYGYHWIMLCPGRSIYSIHRLVAMYHIENPENKPMVDHIDRNRTNNAVQNLRWVTNRENGLNTDYHHKKTDGTHYIRVTPYGSFHVRINGRTKVSKSFNTLEDAVAFRNRFIAENPR